LPAGKLSHSGSLTRSIGSMAMRDLEEVPAGTGLVHTRGGVCRARA
jgi:hypothetical protein